MSVRKLVVIAAVALATMSLAGCTEYGVYDSGYYYGYDPYYPYYRDYGYYGYYGPTVVYSYGYYGGRYYRNRNYRQYHGRNGTVVRPYRTRSPDSTRRLRRTRDADGTRRPRRGHHADSTRRAAGTTSTRRRWRTGEHHRRQGSAPSAAGTRKITEN